QSSSKTGYNILVIFVVTEEWFSFIESEPSYILAWAPHLPANYFPDFFEQVLRKMEAPLEQLIDGLEIHMLEDKFWVNPSNDCYFQWLAPTSVLYVSHASLDSATSAQLDGRACALAVVGVGGWNSTIFAGFPIYPNSKRLEDWGRVKNKLEGDSLVARLWIWKASKGKR
ncbi:hypothetical protein Godav_008391, partial [Gossypium davidsonii]|nr:hypothetical protein [Gossypium davidsonii]